MAGCHVHSVYAGIAGSHIRGMNSNGIVAIKDREVTPADVERVIDAAKAVAIPADQRIIHVIPQEFLIDDQEGIREPVGMSGVRLEARVHLVTGAMSAAQNIVKAVQRCGLEVDDLILEQLASSYSVLTDDEKELGVCLVDIGGVALRTPTQYAEEIKCRYACALSTLTNSDEILEVPGVGESETRQLSRQTLAEVVEPRYEELLTLVQSELRRSGFEDLCAAGIVLTGGSSTMEGVVEMAEDVFQNASPARCPTGSGWLS
ncbi:cell division protein FtsA-like [Oratosquilla oratoria]|uniref:cell division protein FtsA-like n=1 Tax=Oratosquilla oratoria TaxID=337810 RepID=UPI003F760AD5